jgi:hypothetical protein
MIYEPKEILEQLKLEIQIIERGGYLPSVREPHQELRIFRDSASCPNLALEEKTVPCAHCWLAEFIPVQHLNAEEPCHYIPLNERGDTVASLCAAGRAEEAQVALLDWLRRGVERLEKEISAPAAT